MIPHPKVRARVAASALLLALAAKAAHAAPETFELANGDSVSGEVLDRNDERILLRHEVLGELEVPVAKLKAEETAEEKNPGLFGTAFLEGWDRHIEFSFNGARGNGGDQHARGGLLLKYEDEKDRWKIDGVYMLDDDEGTTENHEARLTVDRDWLLPDSPWYGFVKTRYDWDEFQSWEHRLSFFAGAGYALIDRETFRLRGQLGLGTTKRWGIDDDLQPEALIGFDAHWDLSETQTLELQNLLFPDLSKLGEYRNVSKVDWKVGLSTQHNLSLKLGFENEYETDPGEGSDRNDLKYYGGLVLDF